MAKELDREWFQLYRNNIMKTDGDYITVLLRVRGMVQGVGFRYWTMARARELRLGGYVRNLPDGSVETRLCGPGRSVDIMVEFLGQGPPYSIVEGLEVIEKRPAEGPGSDFMIIR